MNIETDEAIEIVENALMFYVEEGISSDKKAQKELENAWNIVMSINRQTKTVKTLIRMANTLLVLYI